LELRVQDGGLTDDIAVELIVVLAVDHDPYSLSRVLVDLVMLLGASGEESQGELAQCRNRRMKAIQRSRRPSSGLAPGIKVRLRRRVATLPVTQSIASRRTARLRGRRPRSRWCHRLMGFGVGPWGRMWGAAGSSQVRATLP
jgi:hypothetical protein